MLQRVLFQTKRNLTMASATSVTTLQRVSAKVLSDKILEEAALTDPSYAVIDVRDDGMREPMRS
jgi:hypothetical protein